MSGRDDGDDVAGAGGPARPVLRVVSGDPSPEELAALLAVLGARSARAARAAAAPPRVRSAWNDPARLVRRTVHPGPDGWRRSGRVTG